MKRIFALLLCAATLLGCLTFIGCGSKDPDYKGQYITAYLTDTIYDLDPAHAYNNEEVSKVVGMMFDTLFKLDSDGKLKKSLVDDYVIKENKSKGEYKMLLYINKGAKWSDGTAVSANDIVFAWQRLLRPENNFEAAALLYDIKNARAAKEGDASIDDVGIYPAEQQMLEINFEDPGEGKTVNYDQFLLNLTSLALAPLRDEIVSKGDDWAKKGATMVCSGPFKLGRVNVTNGHPEDETASFFDSDLYLKETNPDVTLPEGETTDPNTLRKYNGKQQRITDFLLERNVYYYRDIKKDDIDESVTPYKICVDCTLTDEQLLTMYDKGLIMYIGDIPLSLRNNETIASKVKVATKSMSTNTIYLNQNALIDNGTDTPEALYANAKVRQALSMAFDREAIAKAVVYADAAEGLLPTGMFKTGSRKSTFRDACDNTYPTLSFNLAEAKKLIAEAGLAADPADYKIELTVAAYDDVHCLIAEEIVKGWQALGFTQAAVKKVGAITNNDKDKNIGDEIPADICDDLFGEDFRSGRFAAALVDYVAFSPDPYSMLAPFAKAFSGRGMDMSNPDKYELTPHVTGYDNEEYNRLMEEIFAEKKMGNRFENLCRAEEILMTDMPVIPVIFNLDATITSGSIKKVSRTYYGVANFRKAEIKKYDSYLDKGYDYLVENFKPTAEQEAAIKAAWKKVAGQDPAVVDGTDINEMIIKFSEIPTGMQEVYSLHPMWNLKFLSARGCSYTAWNLLRDANNSVYGHFFIKEKARLAKLEAEENKKD